MMKMRIYLIFFIVMILAASAAIRIIPVIEHKHIIGFDVFYHMQSTESLIEKGLFAYDEYGCQGRTLNYPPGFHLILAVLYPFGLGLVVKWLPLIMSMAAMISVFLLSRHVFNEKVAIISMIFTGLSIDFVDATIGAAPQIVDFVLIPIILYLMLMFEETKKKKFFVSIYILLFLLSFTHPLGYIIAFSTLFAYFSLKRNFAILGALIANAIPIILWFVVFFQVFTIPLWGGDAAAKLISFVGINFLTLGIAGLAVSKRMKNLNAKMIYLWTAVIFAGLMQWIIGMNILSIRFLPYLVEPLSIFAGVFLFWMYQKRKIFFVIALSISIVAVIIPSINSMQYLKPIITDSDFSAFQWIKNNTSKDSVFANYGELSGMYFSYYAQRKSLSCPFRENAQGSEERGKAADSIYKYDDEKKANEYIKKFGINYIYFTREEEELMKWKGFYGWKKLENMDLIYNNSDVKIYKTKISGI